MSDTTDTTVAADVAEAPSLTLSDIQNAIAAIDHAADQGAYKGWATIEQVFLVRSRMAAFIAAATPPEAASEDAASESTPDVASDATVVNASTGDVS